MKTRNLILMVLGGAVVAGICWLILNADNPQSVHNWQRTLKLDKGEPYDLDVFYQTMKQTYGSDYAEIPESASIDKYHADIAESGTGVYMFVGKNMYLTESEIGFLEQFANNGGTVFISANAIPNKLFESIAGLRGFGMTNYYADSSFVLFKNKNFSQGRFSFVNKLKNEPMGAYWNCFIKNEEIAAMNVRKSNLIQISTIDSAYNAPSDFLCIYHGEGKILLHANPVYFSNYYLKTTDGRKYLSEVMQHIPKEPIWFDISGGMRKAEALTGETRTSIYDFISQEKSLKYAWWILVIGALAFLFVGGRRKERPISVLTEPQNQTLTLIQSMGYFYWAEQNNVAIFKREWSQFLAFVRMHISIQFLEVGEVEASILSEKSGVDKERILNIFAAYNKYRIFSEITADELFDISNKINQFYLAYKNKNGKQSVRNRIAEPTSIKP